MTFLTLNPRFVLGSLDLTASPFLVNQDGLDFGTGDLVTSVLSSFLQDGDLEVSQRRGNMSLSVPVLIEGNDLLALAQALQSLALEAEKDVNTFSVDPGDGLGPVTVFDTFKADINYTYNANAEQQGFRQYAVTFRALPFGRSEDLVTADAVIPSSSTPTVIQINDGTSTTGWSQDRGSVSTSGGSIRVPVMSSLTQISLNQAFSLVGTPYVFMDYSVNVSSYSQPPLVVNTLVGSAKVFPTRVDALPSGLSRVYWQIPSSLGTSVVKLTILNVSYGSGIFSIDQMARSSALPVIGTTRQQLRYIPVAGSARTPGGIQIASPTSALDQTLVYTTAAADGVTPSLRGLLVSSSSTNDGTRASGAYSTLSTAVVYDIPLASLTPGLYALVALVSAPASDLRTLSWSTTTRVNSVSVGRTVSGSATTSSGTYTFVPLGNVNLPTTGARPGTTAVQRISVNDGGSGTAARLDELYLCNLSTGRLTIVSCGTGTPAAGGPSSRLWLDIASITNRVPSVMRGTAADGSDAFYANDSIQVAGLHEFVPTQATIFTVTTGALDSQVTLTHYPRWLLAAAS